MEELLSNNVTNKWEMIRNLNWDSKSRNHDDFNANDAIAESLIDNYSVDEIASLKNFVVRKRIELQGFIYGYCKGNDDFNRKLKLGDDGIWDLSAHIVGLGEGMYESVYKHPNILLELQKEYVENFEYGFDKAIYLINYAKEI